jgi:anti-sigma regulatory factor (Ser/Thr protein kinase)
MTTISMPKRINDDRIGDAFNNLFRVILEMEKSEDEDARWDFGNTMFLTPFFLLPLMLYKSKCGKNVTCINKSDNICSYFEKIHFENGLKPDEYEVNDFQKQMNSFATRTYIPIIDFPASKSKNDVKSTILDVVEKIFIKQLNIKGQIRIALSYMLAETIDNITEHSNSNRGYIFAQYYPAKHYIDVCIADNGITLLGSFIKNNNKNVRDDLDALESACTGKSTKNRPDAENRGYGIATSKKMLAIGLSGKYFLFSGQAFHLMNKEGQSFVMLPENIRWDGTIVALRIPYDENKDFNYSTYIN